MWSSIIYEEKKTSPVSRSKHSATLLGSHLYLLAGRNGNLALKDFWKYDLNKNSWETINAKGDTPPCLQEHTAVAFKDNIFVFGGELGFSAGNETPLWVYQSKVNSWRKICAQKGTNVPKGRRGHTTLVHHGSALVYGGYCDLRGSSNELWIFHFETESWHLLVNGRNDPPGRHKHSAVLHDDCMWVYGGMTDLQERSDLCRFDIVTKRWSVVKCKTNPGALHSHAVCKLPSSMLIFGGERNGQPSNELWRFHFNTETWERIYTDMFCPQPLSECRAIAIPELLLQDTNDEINNGDENYPPNYEYQKNLKSTLSEESSYPLGIRRRHMNSNEIFGLRLEHKTPGQGIMVPPRRQATTPNSCNLNILREISKLSQINLSLLNGNQNKRCSYRTLNNNSSESINNIEETTNGELRNYEYDNLPSIKSLVTPTVSKNVLREMSSSYGNTVLTPIETTKLVYLDDEQAPPTLSSNKELNDEFSFIHHKCHPANNRNRRSYPISNSVRFANPLVTPEESRDFSSDYTSCENIHRLAYNGKVTEKQKTPIGDKAISFSNPNYFKNRANGQPNIDERISRGDYVKLLGPSDNITVDGGNYEMVEIRPVPPKSLPLLSSGNNNGVSEKQKRYRACSAGRYNEISTNFCMLIIGGRGLSHVTVFKQPISMWKLTLNNQIFS